MEKFEININEEIKLDKILLLSKKILIKELSMDKMKGDIIILDNDSHNSFNYGEVILAAPDCSYVKKGMRVLFDKRHVSAVTIEDITYQMGVENRDVQIITNFYDYDNLSEDSISLSRAKKELSESLAAIGDGIIEKIIVSLEKAKV